MGKMEKAIEIKATSEKVWRALVEWMDEWKSAMYTSEVRTPEDKYRVSESAHVTEKHGKFDLEITESFENEKIMALSKGKYNTLGWEDKE